MTCAELASRKKRSKRQMSSSTTRLTTKGTGYSLVTHGLDRDQLVSRMGGSP